MNGRIRELIRSIREFVHMDGRSPRIRTTSPRRTAPAAPPPAPSTPPTSGWKSRAGGAAWSFGKSLALSFLFSKVKTVLIALGIVILLLFIIAAGYFRWRLGTGEAPTAVQQPVESANGSFWTSVFYMLGAVLLFFLGRALYRKRTLIFPFLRKHGTSKDATRVYVSIAGLFVVNIAGWLMFTALGWDYWGTIFLNSNNFAAWGLLNLVAFMLTAFAVTHTNEAKYYKRVLLGMALIALLGATYFSFAKKDVRGSGIRLGGLQASAHERAWPRNLGGTAPRKPPRTAPAEVRAGYAELFRNEPPEHLETMLQIVAAESDFEHYVDFVPALGVTVGHNYNDEGEVWSVDIGEAQINSDTFYDYGKRVREFDPLEWFYFVDCEGNRQGIMWWARLEKKPDCATLIPQGQAVKEGFNILEPQGNRNFAYALYKERKGFTPWEASEREWSERISQSAEEFADSETVVTAYAPVPTDEEPWGPWMNAGLPRNKHVRQLNERNLKYQIEIMLSTYPASKTMVIESDTWENPDVSIWPCFNNLRARSLEGRPIEVKLLVKPIPPNVRTDC